MGTENLIRQKTLPTASASPMRGRTWINCQSRCLRIDRHAQSAADDRMLRQRAGGNPPPPPIIFIAPFICRITPFSPPLPSFDIIFSVC